MLKPRLIPALLISDGALVKPTCFKNPVYVGDPLNAVRIYAQKAVDELLLIDISATTHGYPINFDLVAAISRECDMPLCYGGGIKHISEAQRLFDVGVDRVLLGSSVIYNPDLIASISTTYGAQAVSACIDVKHHLFSSNVVTHNAKRSHPLSPVAAAKRAVSYGAGEILLQSVAHEGTWAGFDLELIRKVSSAVSVPVIASCGAGCLDHIREAVSIGTASAVSIGSMSVFQGKNLGVLIKFPSRSDQEKIFHGLWPS